MPLPDLMKYRKYAVPLILVVLILFTLWMRLIPAERIVSEAGVNLLGNDPWYCLRQVEQVGRHFPAYAWFDPMTQFPTGETIYWGPLFIWIISAACLLTGAAARPEMMLVASWVPPLMAAAMVPLVYLIGKRVADTKTGLIAASFSTLVSGQYMYRSLFGFVDHHIAEVLFSTLFALAYICALEYSKRHAIDTSDPATLKRPAVLAVLAGVAYFLGFLTMPTMILFALIVAVFTLIQSVYDFYRSRPGEYLLFLNAVTFATVICGVLAFGIKHPGLGLARYTIGHVGIYLAIIAGTGVMYLFARTLRGKPRYYYPLALAGTGIAGALVLILLLPDIYQLLVGNFFAFFGSQAVTLTVQEARPWTTADAWRTFHYGLILMAGGVAAFIYRNLRDEHPEQVFVIVWSLIMLFSTWQHIRYEYYLAVNVALLSAVFIGSLLDACWDDLRGLLLRVVPPDTGGEESEPTPDKKKTKSQKKAKSKKGSKRRQTPGVSAGGENYFRLGVFVLAVAISLLFVTTSVATDHALASSAHLSAMNSDWRESLEWLEANTPDTGVDYYAIYETREGFEYPPEAYGVMSWWDYGHWITFIGKRIPDANPFQRGVSGENGAAAFFMSPTEERAAAILDTLGTKYVITDIEMDTGKFWAMATWYNSSVGASPYQRVFLTPSPGDPDTYTTVTLYDPSYYQTMISRLHNFDTGMAAPSSEVYYIEYMDGSVAEMPYPVITGAQATSAAVASAAAAEFNKNPPPGRHAAVLSSSITQSTGMVPALRHFRLVHESQTDVMPGEEDVRYVKVFEYVPGARIRGEGVIEVTLVTDAGRTFTYRQESVDGWFIVPYSTTGTPYGVNAVGSYRIAGTGMVFDVTEDAVMEGRSIN